MTAGPVYKVGKRVMDVAFSAALLVVTAPAQATVAGLVGWQLGPPVLFRQQRPGRYGAVFTLYKFRTMQLETPGAAVDDAHRMTSLGAVLRRTSLDELPTLWNVLKGDMSLVGPRPLLVEYLPRYDEIQARRHEVRPGVTGLAQVSGRNALTWEERFVLDVHYVDHKSLRLDLAILARTVAEVIRRRGVAAIGHVTMPAFIGTSGLDPT